MNLCNYHNNILLLYSSREVYPNWDTFFGTSFVEGTYTPKIIITFLDVFIDLTDNIYSLTARPVKYVNEMYNKHGLNIWAMKILTQEWEE
jgi:hypothetical protein